MSGAIGLVEPVEQLRRAITNSLELLKAPLIAPVSRCPAR